MNAKNANAILESTNQAIEYILRRDIAAGYGTNEDLAPKWIQAVSQINKEMALVKPAMPDATEILQLLESICNPDVATLEKHKWWPKAIGVKGNGVEGQSSKSVLGKRKAVEVMVEEGKAEQEEDVMEIDEDARAEARCKEKIDGKKKVQDDNPHNNSEDVERGDDAVRKNDVQRKNKALDDGVKGSNENPEYGHPRRRRILPTQGDDTQRLTPKSILLPVKSTSATPSKKGMAAQNGNLYNEPCSKCAKKANPWCYRLVDGDSTACLPCKTGKHRCNYSNNYKLWGRYAVRAQSHTRSKTPALSKPPSPSPMAHMKEQSQSAEVVITSKLIKKPVPSRKQCPSPLPVAGPSHNRNKSVNRSSPIHPHSVPPATAATNSTTRALTPGRAYSLTGVPMATKEELDVLKEELHSFQQELAQMQDKWDKGVKALLRWEQDYQLLQAKLRAVVAERSSLQEEIRNLRIGYGGTSKDLKEHLVLPFQLPPMAPGPSSVSSPGSPHILVPDASTTSPSRMPQTTPPATPDSGPLSILNSPSHMSPHSPFSACASPCPATPALCTMTPADPAEDFPFAPLASLDQSVSETHASSPSHLQLIRLPSPSRLSLVRLPSPSRL
ncbi:hypothetical protein JVU11DRAFT_12469 [Chiua virens]|nr:hypothetical protein JVU11DRAFT_12469 [Chiua virens]